MGASFLFELLGKLVTGDFDRKFAADSGIAGAIQLEIVFFQRRV